MIRVYRVNDYPDAFSIYKIQRGRVYKYHRYHAICPWWRTTQFLHCTNRYTFARRVKELGFGTIEDITGSKEWLSEEAFMELTR